MKKSYTYKGYVGAYNVQIVNSFDCELQHKDTETGNKKKQWIDLLSELWGFKVVKVLALVEM